MHVELCYVRSNSPHDHCFVILCELQNYVRAIELYHYLDNTVRKFNLHYLPRDQHIESHVHVCLPGEWRDQVNGISGTSARDSGVCVT